MRLQNVLGRDGDGVGSVIRNVTQGHNDNDDDDEDEKHDEDDVGVGVDGL